MSVNHTAIAETINDYLDELESVGEWYEANENGLWIEREYDSALGADVTKRVLEEHSAVLVKSQYFPDDGVTRMWFSELEVEEVTEQRLSFA